jgi:hypothetical protein
MADFRWRVRIEELHGQVTSGHSSDEGLCPKRHVIILIARLTTWECQDLILSDQAITLHHRVKDVPAIEAIIPRQSAISKRSMK